MINAALRIIEIVSMSTNTLISPDISPGMEFCMMHLHSIKSQNSPILFVILIGKKCHCMLL
jgi:hypothetical protein